MSNSRPPTCPTHHAIATVHPTMRHIASLHVLRILLLPRPRSPTSQSRPPLVVVVVEWTPPSQPPPSHPTDIGDIRFKRTRMWWEGDGQAALRTRHGDVHVQRLERRVSCEGRRGSGRVETRAWMVAWRDAEVRRPTSRATRNDERWTDRICESSSASSFLLRPKGIDGCATFVGVQPRFAPPATMACRRRTGCETNATSCVHVEATFRHAFAPRLRCVVAQPSSWMVQDA